MFNDQPFLLQLVSYQCLTTSHSSCSAPPGTAAPPCPVSGADLHHVSCSAPPGAAAPPCSALSLGLTYTMSLAVPRQAQLPRPALPCLWGSPTTCLLQCPARHSCPARHNCPALPCPISGADLQHVSCSAPPGAAAPPCPVSGADLQHVIPTAYQRPVRQGLPRHHQQLRQRQW